MDTYLFIHIYLYCFGKPRVEESSNLGNAVGMCEQHGVSEWHSIVLLLYQGNIYIGYDDESFPQYPQSL